MYLMALAILIGAEASAELAKRRDSLFRGHLKAAERQQLRLAHEQAEQSRATQKLPAA
jgi:hypothetical protein